MKGPTNPPTTFHVNPRSLHFVYPCTLATIDFQILFPNRTEKKRGKTPQKQKTNNVHFVAGSKFLKLSFPSCAQRTQHVCAVIAKAATRSTSGQVTTYIESNQQIIYFLPWQLPHKLYYFQNFFLKFSNNQKRF